MLTKYKGYTDLQIWQEYGRLKAEWIKANGWDNHEAYDAFIKRIVKDLGI